MYYFFFPPSEMMKMTSPNQHMPYVTVKHQNKQNVLFVWLVWRVGDAAGCFGDPDQGAPSLPDVKYPSVPKG